MKEKEKEIEKIFIFIAFMINFKFAFLLVCLAIFKIGIVKTEPTHFFYSIQPPLFFSPYPT